MAFKSDVSAKQAYIKVLEEKGYEAKVAAQPADIIATKDGETFYFEIKLTDHTDKCFGAATLTEWGQAFKTPDHYRFVVAIRLEENTYQFKEFSPDEFMQYSTIPPFKIYFNINFEGEATKKTKKTSKKAAIKLTKKNFSQMDDLFNKFRENK